MRESPVRPPPSWPPNPQPPATHTHKRVQALLPGVFNLHAPYAAKVNASHWLDASVAGLDVAPALGPAAAQHFVVEVQQHCLREVWQSGVTA